MKRPMPSMPPRTESLDLRWHFFSRQAAALECADSLPTDVQAQVWSVEHDEQGGGKRSYIVASCEAFWRRYRRMMPPDRHHYEIIRESRPCHLYFDLEFCTVANPQSDGELMVRTLCREIRAALGDSFFDGRCPQCRIVDLDSTTALKFSRHLIVRVNGAAFADSSHVGSFVRSMLASLARRRLDEPLVGALFVAPKASDVPRKPTAAVKASFVDTSVYTRNRCFRLCTLVDPRPDACYNLRLPAHPALSCRLPSGSARALCAALRPTARPTVAPPALPAQTSRARPERAPSYSSPACRPRISYSSPRRTSDGPSSSRWPPTCRRATSCSGRRRARRRTEACSEGFASPWEGCTCLRRETTCCRFHCRSHRRLTRLETAARTVSPSTQAATSS